MKSRSNTLAIDRRHFVAWLLACLTTGVFPGKGMAYSTAGENNKIKVAALQMTPRLGNFSANMEQAEQLIRQAQRQGAQWIVLPEMFTSAAAFHPDMLGVIRPIEGAPAQMMLRLAQQGGSTIGGSFLASVDGDVRNSFLLVSPDGDIQRHDKDQPTYWENCYYQGGTDDGVLINPLGQIGVALCWELIRSRTMRRLKDRVRLLLSGSCWWTLSDDVDGTNPLRLANLRMLQDAPVHCARMLGVPVVHAAHTGSFKGFFSPDLPDIPYDSSYLGESMIVDETGAVVARRSAEEGAGTLIAEITLPLEPKPSLIIPQRFWLPERMPTPWKTAWLRWLKSGAHYYKRVTRDYLLTGKINEYTPEYME